MKKTFTWMALVVPLLAGAQGVNKPKLALHTWANGFSEPVCVDNCGDGRLFVIERAGKIKIITDSMAVNATPFLDIHTEVESGYGEQGLLGMAFPVNYADSGYFFVYYIHHLVGNVNGMSRISRFHVTGDPDVADPASETVIWEYPQPYQNHNGGDLHFGPDGMLYLGLGDGGSGNDPQGNGQDLTEPLAGIIRIDVSNTDSTYTVPTDNPWVNAGGDTLAINWAYGLRNPWRWGFDRLTGDVWIGDVGQNAWEEVDFWPAGDNSGPNFGWRCREAFVATPGVSQTGCGPASDYVAPLAAFDHGGQGWCSVIGGRVYRGSTFPHHYGHYFFTDYCAGDFLTFAQGSMSDVDTMLMTSTSGYVAFGEGNDGTLYVSNLSGQIKKIVDPCPMDAPTVTYDGWELTSSDANAYQWFFNGLAINGATDSAFVPGANGFYQVAGFFPGGCTLKSDTFVFVSTAINEENGDRLSVYPLPAKDEVMLDRSAPASTNCIVHVTDALGREVMSTTWAANEARLRLDVSSWSPGLFTVRCTNATGETTLRSSLIIAR